MNQVKNLRLNESEQTTIMGNSEHAALMTLQFLFTNKKAIWSRTSNRLIGAADGESVANDTLLILEHFKFSSSIYV